jgi:glycosyltransferase involved in cell wall biosynthesis
MSTKELTHLYSEMMETLNAQDPTNWNDISALLTQFSKHGPTIESYNQDEFLEKIRTGLAFWTFDFGIDGVSIEIAKYADCLQEILGRTKQAEIHFIAGDFHPQADNVLKPDWNRHRIERANGWNKWDQGLWFDKLFYQEMSEGTNISREMAVEIWSQAVEMTGKLGRYIADHQISLLIPVNVNSNPGNLVTGLCTVLVSELMGLYVLNSNHDFFWEGGKPASERKSGEEAGPRDKFFHNCKNTAFFSLFKRIYPWNGRRWIQVNINNLQSKKLLTDGFPVDRVLEISTTVSDEFFREYTEEDKKSVRSRMAHILSDGEPIIQTVPVESFTANLDTWMKDQKPLVCSAAEGLRLDLVSDQIHYFLQPTRIIDRKRIEKDWDLIAALLQHPPFREDFRTNSSRQIVLHITGPAPIEHQADLESVLSAYRRVISDQQESIANRLFMAFSIGTEYHSSFETYNFKKLVIEDIYRLASAVVFPSQTEGRGLPIIESSAAGIPIICSRYQPEEIFAGVVGEDLPEKDQIRYIPFPEKDFEESTLDDITAFLLDSLQRKDDNLHNIKVTRQRYSRQVMISSFHAYLDQLRILE